MSRHTRHKKSKINHKTRKHTKKGKKQTKQRQILNPSGLSHIYTSLYGPRAYKGGLVPTMVI